jgi:CRP-like cAMP-binding protein
MIVVEKVLSLREVALFQRMPVRELTRIAAISEVVDCTAGERIFAEGDFGESMFVIVEGQVVISRGNLVLATLGEREYFGEMSLFDGEPRSATATAKVDSLLLEIRQQAFLEILSQHFEAALAVIRLLSQRLRSELERADRI